MEQDTNKQFTAEPGEVRSVIRETIEEFMSKEQARSEPAYKTELLEERKRREQLERRLNEVVQESRRMRQRADEAERQTAIRSELQKLGVAKVDLAFKAVKDDVVRTEDGRIVAKTLDGDMGLTEYLTRFVTENPELLPARIPGGSGIPVSAPTVVTGAPAADIDKIRPGMSAEEAERVRQEVLRVASQVVKA